MHGDMDPLLRIGIHSWLNYLDGVVNCKKGFPRIEVRFLVLVELIVQDY